MTTTTLTTGYVSFASSTYISASNASAVYAAAASTPTLNNAGTLVATGGTSYAVSFAGSGTVTNSGTINGPGDVFFGASGASLSNSGTIISTGTKYGGVMLAGGGTVTNAVNGVIDGSIYAPLSSGPGTSGPLYIDNAGLINASGGFLDDGADLELGGTVTNSGTMIGAVRGIDIRGAAGTITNTGSIYGKVQYGIFIFGVDGLITNTGGTITSLKHAIAVGGPGDIGGADTVINSGVIAGGTTSSGGGVLLDANSALTNSAGGIITGFYGVGAGTSGNAAIVNYGSIRGLDHGIDLPGGGSVSNSGVAADIYGITAGVKGASITLSNDGTILGQQGYGVDATGVITNNPGGRILGEINGVVLGAGSTLTNAGLIAALDGNYAVTFAGAGRLVVDPGAAFTGLVAGGGSTLELAAGGSAGTLSDIGGKYTGFGQVTVDSGATWTIDSITAPVAITAGDGSLTVAGAIDAGASFNLDSIGVGETLTLSAVTGAGFANTISNFSANNEFVLPGVTFADGDTASFDGVQTLSVLEGSTTVFSFSDITLQGGRTDATFIVGTHSVQEIACFRAGTRIATPAGPIAVERLSPGDLVLTRDGARPVRWIGQRRLDCRRHERPGEVLPVRVQAHAFGPQMPHADLFLSPDHAVHVADGSARGALIPIRYLLNGASICQIAATEVHYFHLELDAHAVLFAEGLACESYLDTGNRTAFANPPVVRAHGGRKLDAIGG